MKNFLLLSLVSLSLQSFAIDREWHDYTGSNNGAACSVSLALNANKVSAVGITFGQKASLKNQTLIIEGSADFVNAKAIIMLDSSGEPTSLKLQTKNPIKPFYTTKLTCTNLVRTK